ncbi:MAG: DUF1573 domain-containing protein [Planctomycetaceae bacterium]|nr:DUF1573 domain-containing protein [Planctomycetaceae bacterium]
MLRSVMIVCSLALVGGLGYLMLRSAHATANLSRQAELGTPRMEFDTLSYDFGVMDVGETGQHTFTVRNTGDAPLKIKVASTTCKCTLIAAPADGIPPGESRELKLEWKTIQPIDGFRHGGTLSTNDPRYPAINVRVEGRVRARVAHVPEVVTMGQVLQGYPTQATATIISQVWDQFTLEIIDCSLPQVRVELAPPDQTVISGNEWTRSAQGLRFTYDASQPVGTYRGQVRYRVHAPGEPLASQTIHELPITIDVVTPFSLHGRHVDQNAIVWGPIRQNMGRRDSLFVVGRKLPSDFAIEAITVEPPVLRVTQRRQDDGTTTTGRFAIDLELPKAAGLVNCMTPNAAVITLQTNHPLYPQVKFYAEFAVVE